MGTDKNPWDFPPSYHNMWVTIWLRRLEHAGFVLAAVGAGVTLAWIIVLAGDGMPTIGARLYLMWHAFFMFYFARSLRKWQ